LKALVTGASGFIGSHVADVLAKTGIKVVAVLRKSSKTKWLENKGFEFVYTDNYESSDFINAVKNVNYVFHVAGLNFAKRKDDYYKVNTLGTRSMLESVYKHNPNIRRFVYIGSQTATGPSSSFNHPVDEDSPLKPVTDYGRSKKLAEESVMSYFDKLPYTIIKPPAVFGPRDTAIYSLFRMMYFGFAAHIGLNKKYISLIHSHDLARGTVEAALSENAVNQTYFLTNDKFYDWDYISDVFKVQMNKSFYIKLKVPDPIVLTVGAINGFLWDMFGRQAKFDYNKAIDFTREFWTCKSDKAKRDFGFQQTLSFNDAVRTTFEWYKFHKWL
jgi:nucleoside-diphosphate-sugar epimerase